MAGGQAAGSGYTKAPVSAPPAPGTDINNMYVYLYIYIPAGWGQKAGGHTLPQGPEHSTDLLLRGLGAQRHTEIVAKTERLGLRGTR